MDRKQVAGVAGLPEASKINGCDTAGAVLDPAEMAGNPRVCRTFEPDPEIIHRLFEAMELRGVLPAFRRGRMCFDSNAGKVRVAPQGSR